MATASPPTYTFSGVKFNSSLFPSSLPQSGGITLAKASSLFLSNTNPIITSGNIQLSPTYVNPSAGCIGYTQQIIAPSTVIPLASSGQYFIACSVTLPTTGIYIINWQLSFALSSSVVSICFGGLSSAPALSQPGTAGIRNLAQQNQNTNTNSIFLSNSTVINTAYWNSQNVYLCYYLSFTLGPTITLNGLISGNLYDSGMMVTRIA